MQVNSPNFFFFTLPQNRGGVIFLLQFVCVSVCVSLYVSVRLCLWIKFQPNERTDLDQIFAKGLLTTLAQTLFKGQGHNDAIPIFLHNTLLTSLLCISALLCLIEMKFGMSLRYNLGQFMFKFNRKKIEWWWRHYYDVIQVFSKQFSISQILLNLQTSYLEPIHNNITSI